MTGVTEPHPTSLFINPAALAWAPKGTHLYIEGRTGISHGDYSRQRQNPIGADLDSVSSNGFAVSPAGSFVALFVQDNVTLGVGIDMPVSETWPSGSAHAYHVDGGYLRRLSPLNFGIAFKLGGRISFAGLVSYRISFFRSSFLFDTALADGRAGLMSDCGGSVCGIENPLAARRYDVSANNLAFELDIDNLTFSGGAMLKLFEGLGKRDWFLAVGYSGEDFSKLSVPGDVTVTKATRNGGEQVKGSAEVLFGMPQELHVGVRGPITTNYDIYTHFRYRTLEQQRTLDYRFFGRDLTDAGIPERLPRHQGFNSVASLHVGIMSSEYFNFEYYQNGDVIDIQRERLFRWGLSIGGELPTVSNNGTNAQHVAPWNVTAAGSLIWRFHPRWTVEGSYAFTFFAPVTSSDSQYAPDERLSCIEANYEFDQCAAFRDGRAIPSAAGDYQRVGHDFRVGLRVSF